MSINDIFKQIDIEYDINNINKIVVNLSGGLDSTILLYALYFKFGCNKLVAISFDYNQKNKLVELFQASKSCKKLGIKHVIIPVHFLENITKNCCSLVKSGLKIPSYNDIEINNHELTTYVPFRNLIISSISLSFAESIHANAIALGIQYGDYENNKYEYWDCSTKFKERLQNLVFLNPKNKIYIITPFINLKKEQELFIAMELKVPLEDTWTCYDPNITIICNNSRILYAPCLKCPSCNGRIEAFKK